MEKDQNNKQDNTILSNSERVLGNYNGKYILPEDMNDGDEEVCELLEGSKD